MTEESLHIPLMCKKIILIIIDVLTAAIESVKNTNKKYICVYMFQYIIVQRVMCSQISIKMAPLCDFTVHRLPAGPK